MSLYTKFLSFNKENQLFAKEDKILLAVSGGIDSMTLMHLYSKLNQDVVVVHCNFKLRGAESDGDERFVKEYAEKLGFPFLSKSFNTKTFGTENKLSIQMAARELRYNWFREVKKQLSCAYIAVAHNRDDALETFFINLGRGTGIKGLISIQASTEDVIRPLLFATRKEITAYCTDEQLPYREDSSNISDKYIRNFIRHKIIPSFEEIFPSFRDTIAENISKLKDISELYDYSANVIIPQIFTRNKKLSYINIPALLNNPAPKTILFETLSEFGFTPPSISEIFNACFSESGKQFYSPSYKLIKDRDQFIITKLESSPPEKIYIDDGTNEVSFPINLEFLTFNKPSDFRIEPQKNVALIDYDKVSFPLILRKWQPGDYFIPLGMKGIKKLSDFFIDEKMSIIDKENTWLITSGQDIIWIIGHRIDNRFKITNNTNQVLKINYIT